MVTFLYWCPFLQSCPSWSSMYPLYKFIFQLWQVKKMATFLFSICRICLFSSSDTAAHTDYPWTSWNVLSVSELVSFRGAGLTDCTRFFASQTIWAGKAPIIVGVPSTFLRIKNVKHERFMRLTGCPHFLAIVLNWEAKFNWRAMILHLYEPYRNAPKWKGLKKKKTVNGKCSTD